MTVADDAAIANVPPDDIERARTAYEMYARTVGVAPRWPTLPVRLQLGWVEATRAARAAGGGVVVPPGTADGARRYG